MKFSNKIGPTAFISRTIAKFLTDSNAPMSFHNFCEKKSKKVQQVHFGAFSHIFGQNARFLSILEIGPCYCNTLPNTLLKLE